MDDHGHEGHRLRMREKRRDTQFETFANHEVIEQMLYTAQPRGDTNELAHALIRTFGSVQGVLNATEKELLRVEGMGEGTARVMRAYAEAVKAYRELVEVNNPVILSRADAVCFSNELFRNKTMCQTWIALIDLGGCVIHTGRLYAGVMWMTERAKFQIIEKSLEYDAHYVVMFAKRDLNMGGISRSDRNMVHEMAVSLKNVGITLIDYLVITPRRTISLRCDVNLEDNVFEKTEYGMPVNEQWIREKCDVWELQENEEIIE